jgi:hypothetical protein
MSSEDYAAAIKAVNDGLKEQLDAEHALIDPQFAVLDATQKLTDAQNHYMEVSAYGTIQNSETVAALNDVAKANADVDYATQSLTAAYQTGAVSIDETRSTLQTWVAQGRLTQKQADDIAWSLGIAKQQAEAYGGVNVTAQVHLDNSQAIAAADAFAAKMRGLAAMGIVTVFNRGERDPLAGHAKGGRNIPDGTFVVGEDGPELASLHNGQLDIISNPRTAGGYRPSSAPTGGRSTQRAATEHVHLYLDGKEVAAAARPADRYDARGRR